MDILGPILSLALLLAAPPEAKAEGGPAPAFDGIHVLVRTQDDLVTGWDLRYKEGEFRIRQEKGEVALPEAKVTEVQFLDLPHDETRDLTVRVAAHVAFLRRAQGLKRFFLQRVKERTLIRPEQPLAETFRRLVPRMWHPDLTALLCVEAAQRGFLDRKPKEAVALFEEAEKASKDRPDHAFIYGLMRVAAGMEPPRTEDVQGPLRQLEEAYPTHRLDVFRFRKFLRDEADRPFPPRPPKGLGTPP